MTKIAPGAAHADPADPDFAADVLASLAESPRRISPKWFYDEVGSDLFDRICELPEYPVTRAETGLLTEHAEAIGAAIRNVAGPGGVLSEPGAGTGEKAAHLLAQMEASAYAASDINAAHLETALAPMRAAHPGLVVPAIESDITVSLALPEEIAALGPVVGFFPGSTIGNFPPDVATDLLARFRSEAGAAAVVVGFDGVKTEAEMVAAYDDAAGVTSAFNRNVLTRINREAAGTLDTDGFAHRSVWNAPESRIEMHLLPTRDQRAEIAGTPVAFKAGEPIVTSHSRKFTPAAVDAIARDAGWQVARRWTVAPDAYTLALLA